MLIQKLGTPDNDTPLALFFIFLDNLLYYNKLFIKDHLNK